MKPKIPYLDEKTLLNFAATAPISDDISEAMKEVCEQMKAPLGSHFYTSLGMLERARKELADFLHAEPNEIAFTQNTSTSISMISQAIKWSPGDIIVVADDEFPSNRFVWEFLQSKFQTEVVYINPVPGEDFLKTFKEAKLDLDKVKLLAISPVSYRTGRRYKLKEICHFCKQKNIYSFFDAIQAIGVFDLNVKELDVDFLVGGAQKWLLGPIGCGYLYVNPKRHKEVQSPMVGWCSLEYPEKFEMKKQGLADEMTQFEPGLPNLFSIAGLMRSLNDFKTIGMKEIEKRIAKNTEYLDQIIESYGLKNLRHPNDGKAGIASFFIPDKYDMRDWIAFFEEKKISLTIRDQYVRVSPHYFSTKEDLDIFKNALGEILNEDAKELEFKNELLKNEIEPSSTQKRILLLGGTGVLGAQLLKDLSKAGYLVDVVGRDQSKIDDILNPSIHFYNLDVTNTESLNIWLDELKLSGRKYEAMINCLAHLEVGELSSINHQGFEESFKVNVFASFKIIDFYLKHLVADGGIGFVNVVSTSGRCGYPLLSCYGATQAALWAMTESIHRELIPTNLMGKVYVASAMHSKLQKKIGRTALRYFKSDGVFDYDHSDLISKDLIQFLFEDKKMVRIAGKNKIQVIINAIFPEFINKKIAKKLIT